MDQGRSLQLESSEKNYSVPMKKRIIVGSSDSADLQIRGRTVSDIHCLIEVQGDKYKIFSLSPQSKVIVNGSEVVAQELKLNDVVKLGESEFKFTKSSLSLPKTPIEKRKKLPKPLPVKPEINQDEVVYDENYPLSKDSDAQFSEYIFEDSEEIYPIFKYEVEKRAAEVIILFKDKILSIDYIPQKDGIYKLAGVTNNLKDIEFAYLGKEEKIPFIEIRNGEIFVSGVPGFEHKSFSDSSKTGDSILLEKDDIHLFDKEELKIFVKGDEAPPHVKSAPVLRRDNEFKKYLILCFLFVAGFLSAVSFYEVDPELEKEKVPERIATILYKPKQLRVTKKNDPVKDIKKKIKKRRKAPVKKSVSTVKKAIKQTKSKGTLKAKSKSVAKKGSPRKGPTNNKKIVRTAKKKAGKPGKTSRKKVTVKRVSPNKKFKGRVDTYKSEDFTSSISSLMAKGGALSAVKSKAGLTESYEDKASSFSSSDSAQVKRANVQAKVGSLSSQTKGKLADSFGTDGLVQKKQVYIAGVPYKEVILGSIDRNDIMRILLENVPQFRYCYQKELDVRQAGLDGVLPMNFVIGPSGHVTRARVTSTSKNLPASVNGCIVSHLKTIQFPRPKGGSQVSVNTALNLHSKSL